MVASTWDNMIKWVWWVVWSEAYQHHREVHSNHRLEEERFEVVCHVGDDDEEHGGDVDSEDGAQEPPAQHNLHLDPPGDRGVDAGLADEVLGEVLGSQVVQLRGDELYKLPTISLGIKQHGTGLGVEGVPGHVIVTEELDAVNPAYYRV